MGPALAPLAYLLLHPFAGPPTGAPTPGQAGGFAVRATIGAGAGIFQYVVPVLCLIGSAGSAWKRHSRRALADQGNVHLIDGQRLKRLLAGVQPGQAPQPTGVSARPRNDAERSHAPACPQCAKTMVKRVASRGPNRGNTFWGCSDYPGCKGVRTIAAE